ncbi:uncharacterized protein [Henckelia pumila]|uniref:uncharacterized protein n=1 Tax=Henckelia pumila TaxID=405737 RepID=UPI003C6DFA67
MAPYEALYERSCRTPLHWDEVGERAVLGPKIVIQIVDVIAKIRDRMLTAQSRQKSYADQRRRDLEQVRRLRNKEIPMVKVLWRNQLVEEATWETEQDMPARYPELFGNDDVDAFIDDYVGGHEEEAEICPSGYA